MTEQRIFLSYCREDAEKVSRVRKAIEDAGLKSWRDEEDLRPGDNLEVKIKQAIDNSYAFVVFLSSAQSSRKNWSVWEAHCALERHKMMTADKNFVIPVRLEDIDMPPLGSSGPQLQDFVWVDLWREEHYDKEVRRLIDALHTMTPDSPESASGPVAPAESAALRETITADSTAAGRSPDRNGEKKSFTSFVIIAGRHPAALLAGDDDLDTVQACIKRAEHSHGQDWLFWLGEQAPADMSADIKVRENGSSFKNGISFKGAKPDDAARVASQICGALAADRSVVDLKIVVTAPLMYWRGEWWAIGSVGGGASRGVLEGEGSPEDSYFFHLPTLLDRLVPEPEDKMPVTEVHFHRYRFWGQTGPEQMPFDLPDEEDFAAFKRASEKFRDVDFLSESVGNWAPTGAIELPAVEESSGDSRDRQETLTGKGKPTSRRPGGVCLVGRRGDRKGGWMRKLKRVLEERGVLKVFEVVQRPRRTPYEEPAVLAILRSELVDVPWIRDWIMAMSDDVPIWSFDPDSDDLAEWRFEGGLGEAFLLEQAAALQGAVAQDPQSQALGRWDLRYAAVELTQTLYPGRGANVDPIVQRVWERLQEQVDPDCRGSRSPEEDEVYDFVQRCLISEGKGLAEQVLQAYAEAGELFFVEGHGVELRRAPKHFLRYLGMFAEKPPERPKVGIEPALWLSGLGAASEDHLVRSWILKHPFVLDGERSDRWPKAARRAGGLLAVAALDWPPLAAKLVSVLDLADERGWPVVVWGLHAASFSGLEADSALADGLYGVWRSGLERLEGQPGLAFGQGQELIFQAVAPPALEPTDREDLMQALATHHGEARTWLADAVEALSEPYGETEVAKRRLLLAGIGRHQLSYADEASEMWRRNLELLGPVGCRQVVEQAAGDVKGHSARTLDELLERWHAIWAADLSHRG